MSSLPQFRSSPGSRALAFGSARLHGRIARQLGNSSPASLAARVNSGDTGLGALWNPVRLDLLKAPLTRRREA